METSEVGEPLFFPTSPSAQSIDETTTPKTQGPVNLLSQDSDYAKRYRKLLDQLVAIGIEQLIDVPKVVVVGSQSAGKSSILEALSGITFPRDSGTCTRCPSELRLFSSNKDWVCTVSLRREKIVDRRSQKDVQVTPFGPPITVDSHVQRRLLLAQRAILNPLVNVEEILHQKEEIDYTVKNELQFSESVICIDVKGKNVRDLAVVDLPGLIGNDKDDSNVDLVLNLAKKAIKKENCIILCCISMNEDYQIQRSVALAKEADPTGKRTLGVLTKPDRPEKGTFKHWKPIIEGHDQKLFHNYYVVKNPNPENLGKMSWKEARDSEREFFLDEPWASMAGNIKSRLGADNLAAKLSALLEQIIKEQMPLIIRRVRIMHREVKQALASIPVHIPESELVGHLDRMIDDFAIDFRTQLLVSQKENSLADDIFSISLDFWADMINHRPRFLALTDTEYDELQMIPQDIKYTGLKKLLEMRDYMFEEDTAELKARRIVEQIGLYDPNDDVASEAGESDQSGKNGHLQQQGSVGTVANSYTGDFNDADDESLVPLLLDLKTQTRYYGSSSFLETGLDESVVLINLSEITRIKARSTRDLLPGNIPWQVKEQLIENCIKSWPILTLQALKAIEARILKESSEMVTKHFSQFHFGGLEDTISQIMETLISDGVKETDRFLAKLAKIESRYTTINTHDFLARKAKLKDDFAKAREGCIKTIGEEELAAFVENVDDELTLIAEIRLYWQVAFKRYTDNVRSTFFTILLRSLADDCLRVLKSKLGILDPSASSKIKGLLQEDQDTVHRRNDQMAKEATLSQSLEVITKFKSGTL